MAVSLNPQAQQKFSAYNQGVAQYYGSVVGREFTATPSIEQILIDRVVEYGGPFMPYFDMIMVDSNKGEKILMEVSGATASRTDTSGNGQRRPKDFMALTNRGYELHPTEVDVKIGYKDINAWAKFPDFPTRYQAAIQKSKANNIVMCGFHGKEVATATNLSSNPLLQDLHIGWLELIRRFSINTVATQYALGTADNPIQIGSATYPNLDVLVTYAKNRIKPWLRNNLIVAVSDNLVAREEGSYYAQTVERAAEKLVILQNGIDILKTFGGLKAIVPPFFPDDTILIFALGSLQYYTLTGSVRRNIEDWPRGNCINDFNTSESGYVVYNEEACFLIEGIT